MKAHRLLGVSLLCLQSVVLQRPALGLDGDCGGERPWVELSAGMSRELTNAVLSDLRAGLRPNNIDVCELSRPGLPAPLARVSIRTTDAERATFSVDVVDLVTSKRVGRDLELGGLPSDGRPLALAITAEELLRASWAELMLKKRAAQHNPSPPLSPEVRAVVDSESEPPEPGLPSFRLGAGIGFEHFLGGQNHYGLDASFEKPLGPHFELSLLFGVRRALSVDSTHGVIEARGAAAETRASFILLDSGPTSLETFLAARGLLLIFDGDPSGDAESEVARGFVLTARTGLAFTLARRRSFCFRTALGAGLPIQSASASDAERTVTGASGVELFAATSFAWGLP